VIRLLLAARADCPNTSRATSAAAILESILIVLVQYIFRDIKVVVDVRHSPHDRPDD
jgi:hypothetical protein